MLLPSRRFPGLVQTSPILRKPTHPHDLHHLHRPSRCPSPPQTFVIAFPHSQTIIPPPKRPVEAELRLRTLAGRRAPASGLLSLTSPRASVVKVSFRVRNFLAAANSSLPLHRTTTPNDHARRAVCMTLIGYPSRRLSRAQHGFTFLRIGAMSSKLQNTRGGANFFESLESRQFLSTTVTPALTTTPVGATTIQH